MNSSGSARQQQVFGSGRYNDSGRWLEEEELVEANPRASLRPPTVPEKPVPVLSLDQLWRVLKCNGGKSFDNRRDDALLRVFIDTGRRRGIEARAGATVVLGGEADTVADARPIAKASPLESLKEFWSLSHGRSPPRFSSLGYVPGG